MLKLRPFEAYVGTSPVILYVGIRADEPRRTGYISTKPNIRPRFPFVEDGITRQDVLHLLDDSGLGLPEYYSWRSRSGCYFCFFQQLREWVGLLEKHPDLFWKAAEFEKLDELSGKGFTWLENQSLRELAADPRRLAQIKEDYEKARRLQSTSCVDSRLLNVFGDDATERQGCLVCHL